MKKRYNINLDDSIRNEGAANAKAEGKLLNIKLSFSQWVENLIKKENKRIEKKAK